VIQDISTCIYTYDHRFGDASQNMIFMKVAKAFIEDPENFNLDSYPDSIGYEELALSKKQK